MQMASSCTQQRITAIGLLLLLLHIPHSIPITWQHHMLRRIGGPARYPDADDTAQPADTRPPLGRPASWIHQRLDHFDDADERVWDQRYLYSCRFYRSGGPIFLQLGGEWQIQPSWMKSGAWIPMAEENHAMLFYLEHRFYGGSIPLPSTSTTNLRYLHTQQAIGDIGHFIETMNRKWHFPAGTKWIAFGGSYAGSLASWARQQLPGVLHGAVTSSAPLVARADYPEYMDIVEESLRTQHSQECVANIAAAVREVQTLIKHPEGRHELDQKFNTCNPLARKTPDDLDTANLLSALAYNVASVVQYNGDNSPSAIFNITYICDIMVDPERGTRLDRFAEITNQMQHRSNMTCLDYDYKRMVKTMRHTSWQSHVAMGIRQWTYQTCAQFGYYQTSDNERKMFGNSFDLQFFARQCEDIFGPAFGIEQQYANFNRTNALYGGTAKLPTNVLYVQGSVDPWWPLGIPDSAAVPLQFIHGTAHCANMYQPASDRDGAALVATRRAVQAFVRKIVRG